MAIVREIVTRLSFQVKSDNLNKYRRSIADVAEFAQKAAKEVREANSAFADASAVNKYRAALGGVATNARKAASEIRKANTEAGKAFRESGPGRTVGAARAYLEQSPARREIPQRNGNASGYTLTPGAFGGDGLTSRSARVSQALSRTSMQIAQTARDARNLRFDGLNFTPSTAPPVFQRTPRVVGADQVRPMLDALKRGETGLSRFAKKTGAVSDGMEKVRRRAEGVRESVEDVTREWRGTSRSIDRATRDVRQHGRETREAGGAVESLRSLWFAIGGTIAAISLGRMSDEYKSVNNQLTAILDTQQQVAKAEDAIYQTAIDSRAGYGATAELFASIQRGAHLYNLEMQDTVQLTENINKLMAMGKSGPGAQAALIQFTQAIASGELRGQELRSVMEQSQPLAMAVAEAMGVTQDRLLEMGESGDLKVSQILDGLLRQTDEINAKFEGFQWTFAQAFTRARTVLTHFIGEADRKLGFTNWLIQRFIDSVDMLVAGLRGLVKAGTAGFGWLAEAVGGAENAARLLKFMLIAAIGPAALKMLAKFGAKLKKVAWASLGPWALIAGAILAALLIGEDLVAWANGAESVFGTLVGPFSEWKDEIGAVKEAFTALQPKIDASAEAIGNLVSKVGELVSLHVDTEEFGNMAIWMLDTILTKTSDVANGLGNVLDAFIAISNGDWMKAAGILKDAAAAAIVTQVMTVTAPARTLIREVGADDAFQYVKNAFTNVEKTPGWVAAQRNPGSWLAGRYAIGGNSVGDVSVTNYVTTASGSPQQVMAGVERGNSRAFGKAGIPYSPGSVERSP